MKFNRGQLVIVAVVSFLGSSLSVRADATIVPVSPKADHTNKPVRGVVSERGPGKYQDRKLAVDKPNPEATEINYEKEIKKIVGDPSKDVVDRLIDLRNLREDLLYISELKEKDPNVIKITQAIEKLEEQQVDPAKTREEEQVRLQQRLDAKTLLLSGINLRLTSIGDQLLSETNRLAQSRLVTQFGPEFKSLSIQQQGLQKELTGDADAAITLLAERASGKLSSGGKSDAARR